MSKRTYAVVASKFHNGGILFKSSSPRAVYKWRRAHHDGCFDGTGCEGYAVTDDGGATWYAADIHWEQHIWCGGEYPGDISYQDGIARVDVSDRRLLPADATWSAMQSAL